MTHEPLYKYLPSQFADSVLKEGAILFRNLTYFRKFYDGEVRRDETEGIHVDHPDNDVTISSLDGKKLAKGNFRFLNAVRQDEIYIFCLSRKYEEKLFDEFESDACIEIVNPRSFIARCKTALRKRPRFRKNGLRHRMVEYYKPNEPAPLDIQEPSNIPFLKNSNYEWQGEYRLVFGTKNGFEIERSIVTETYTFEEEITSGASREIFLRIGSIESITNVIYKDGLKPSEGRE